MNVKVITYAEPGKLIFHPSFAPYLNALHIGATAGLSVGLTRRYQTKTEVISGPIISVMPFLEALLGDWMKPEIKLLQFTSLTKILRDFSKGASKSEENYLRAFRLNQSEVLTAVRTLQEAGLSPNALVPQSPEETLFLKIWDEMRRIKGKHSLDLVVDLFNEKDLGRLIATDYTTPYLGNFDESTPVVLHGFYYLTPLQHRVFTEMGKMGRPLLFANLYDTRYPEAFRTVEEFIHPKWGWPNRAKWYHIDGAEKTTERKGKAYVFERFSAFLEKFEETRTTTLFVSTRHEALNERIRGFYPKAGHHRHFLSYPVGRFLLHIHKMWDEVSEQIVLGQDCLYECFSSGWLTNGRENARDYTSVLRRIFPFFDSCSTLEEWILRSEHLLSLREHAAGPFERYPVSGKNSRFHRMMENPFLRFSHFQATLEEISAVSAFIVKLSEIARELFLESGGTISISSHFGKLEKLIKEGLRQSDLIEEEKELVKELLRRIVLFRTNDSSFMVQDLAGAIALYLGGDFENDEFEEDFGDEKARSLTIRKIDEVDRLLFFPSNVHFCGFDEESFPLAASTYPWPLNRDFLESGKAENVHIQMLSHLDGLTKEIARYVLFQAEHFSTGLEFSWIRNWEDKLLDSSVYLRLRDISVEAHSMVFSKGPKHVQAPSLQDFSKVASQMRGYPNDVIAEFILCPRRFFYSFVLNEQGFFQSDFHHQFLMSSMVKASLTLTKRTHQQIVEQVSLLFPYWTDLRKQELVELAIPYSSRRMRRRGDVFDGRQYSEMRKSFQFLVLNQKDESGENLLKRSLKAYSDPDCREKWVTSLEEQLEYAMMEASPSNACRYCPHLEVCGEGFYPKDDETRAL